MRVLFFLTTMIALIAFVLACQRSANTMEADVWDKVRLNFRKIDHEGLSGASGSKVSVHYEFCIPAEKKYLKKVQKIDLTAQCFRESKGRIGCTSKQWLIIGHTNQPNYRLVLYRLAQQPFIERIEETYWE